MRGEEDTERGVGEREEEESRGNESENLAAPVSVHLESVPTCFELFFSSTRFTVAQRRPTVSAHTSEMFWARYYKKQLLCCFGS